MSPLRYPSAIARLGGYRDRVDAHRNSGSRRGVRTSRPGWKYAGPSKYTIGYSGLAQTRSLPTYWLRRIKSWLAASYWQRSPRALRGFAAKAAQYRKRNI